jgi:hydroxymethylpyrimidine/phosphomethylpyrimidine kinase
MRYFALTIAGSDSGGGAGIQADLKTFAALGVHGLCALTAVTAQNSLGVTAVQPLPPKMISAQIEAVMEDIGCQAAKTGMLFNAAVIKRVARDLKNYRLQKLVVDPVMTAKGGQRLLLPSAERALIEELLPLAWLVTPNLDEAWQLAGMARISNLEEMEEAARRIWRLGPKAVLVKGGHLKGAAIDLFYDGQGAVRISAPRRRTSHTHGTGCTLSAAVTAYLARGLKLREAVVRAKAYLLGAIDNSYATGGGHGCLDHMWPYRTSRHKIV